MLIQHTIIRRLSLLEGLLPRLLTRLLIRGSTGIAQRGNGPFPINFWTPPGLPGPSSTKSIPPPEPARRFHRAFPYWTSLFWHAGISILIGETGDASLHVPTELVECLPDSVDSKIGHESWKFDSILGIACGHVRVPAGGRYTLIPQMT